MKICVMVKRYCPLQTADFLIMQYHGVDGSRKSRKPLHKSKELFLNNRKKGLFKKNECVENCDCDDKQIIQLTKKYNKYFKVRSFGFNGTVERFNFIGCKIDETSQ